MFLLFERTGEEFFRTKSQTKRSRKFYLGIKALNDLFPDGTVPYNNWQRRTNLSRFSLSPHCVIWRSFPPGVLFGRPANTFPQPFIKPHAGQAKRATDMGKKPQCAAKRGLVLINLAVRTNASPHSRALHLKSGLLSPREGSSLPNCGSKMCT